MTSGGNNFNDFLENQLTHFNGFNLLAYLMDNEGNQF